MSSSLAMDYGGYPTIESDARRVRTAAIKFPSYDELAPLHSVALKADVKIISAVQQLPKISTNGSATVVDVARVLANKALIPFFSGAAESIQEFSSVYNGKGMRRLVRSLAGATISRAAVADLLASILEDALIATSSHLMTDGSNIVILDREAEFVLSSAIAERLPRIYEENAISFAERLLNDLKSRLGRGGALAIDDGAVFLASNKLHIVDVGNKPISFRRTNEDISASV
jgi:hypothetical protein